MSPRQDNSSQPLTQDAEAALIATIREAFDVTDGIGPSASASFRDYRSSTSAPPLLTSATGLERGSRLGDFEIINGIGHGGMGIVYRARQISLNREVGLKVLPPIARYRSSAVRRFRTEAQAVARLNHPNVVPVFVHGEHHGHLYYAMELVHGVSLDTAIRSQPGLLSSTFDRAAHSAAQIGNGRSGECSSGSFPSRQRADDSVDLPASSAQTSWTQGDYRHWARLIADVADGLAHAHHQGVIHRDIKPQNLLLDLDGRLRITDFGLAHLTDEPHATLSGEIMGTPAYLSPEQARGDTKTVDHRTDIYSLGATLYEMLTHRRPFEGDSREQILTRIRRDEPRRPRRLDTRIPPDLETICLRAMHKEPARRHASATELAQDLRRFAEGRPTLSRPSSPWERAYRLALRHRAACLVILGGLTLGVLLIVLAASMNSARLDRGNRLAEQAYEFLAFNDYHAPDQVKDEIERALALGADEHLVNKAQALAALGAGNQAQAVEQLTALLLDSGGDSDARYMLAWAQQRSHDAAGSRTTFESAEQLGGPATAAAWFFRGLALHFDQPEPAIESYRQANALRAEQHQFFPQALLHLARAYNQQMYVNRSSETFWEAESGLRQLVEHGHYGAYPYYLLSIAHRLAGEISSASGDENWARRSSDHFNDALAWARRGQAVDPQDDRSVTAEAECLERLGRLDEAIEARTRAIQLADKDAERCENYHYRWRLFYWTGDLQAALADIRLHSACMPASRFYAHLYPALVLADLDRMDQAVAETQALTAETQDDPQAVLWSAAWLRLLGEAEQAELLLAQRAAGLKFDVGLTPPQTESWIRALYQLCAGERTLEDLLNLAETADSPRKLRAEVLFHAGVLALANGDRGSAMAHLNEAYLSFDGELGYTFHAKILCDKLRSDPLWPTWGSYGKAKNEEMN